MTTQQPQDIPNDPACDAGQAMKQCSYRQQYANMLDDTAPIRGVYGDIACEIAGLEMNAEKDLHDPARTRFNAGDVMR